MVTVVTELEIINAMGITGSQCSKGQVMALNHQRQDECGDCNGHSRVKATIRVVWLPQTMVAFLEVEQMGNFTKF